MAGALLAVLLVNLVLSGDNAVVIGLAARGLPVADRRRAIMFGGGFAVLLRVLLTVPAEALLQVPFLRATGGVLLIWISFRLLTEVADPSDRAQASSVSQAIKLIILADLTMSLDNIIAVAAVAERSPHDVLVLVVGLAISIPLVLVGGNLVARLMQRLPILVWVGGAILVYTAGQLIADDVALKSIFNRGNYARVIFALLVMVVLLAAAFVTQRRRHHEEPVETVTPWRSRQVLESPTETAPEDVRIPR
ncbi:MAG: TerC family protein [Thermomicrobiales bacterium]